MAHLRRMSIGLLVLALAGCSSAVRREDLTSACATGETSYACQVERYSNVNAD